MAYGEFSSTGPDDMLREHLANGLPAAADVARLLHASGRQMEIVRGKSMNLRVRRWVMRRWMGRGFWDLAFYRAGVILIPFRRRLDAGCRVGAGRGGPQRGPDATAAERRPSAREKKGGRWTSRSARWPRSCTSWRLRV